MHVVWRALFAVLAIVLVIVLALFLRSRDSVRWGGADVGSNRLEWQDAGTVCLPPGMVAQCLQAAASIGGFGPLTSAERGRLDAAAAEISTRWGVAVDGGALEGMRRMETALAAQRLGARAQRVGPQLLTARAAGQSIVTIARQLAIPPVAALKQLLVESGYSEARVRAAISGAEAIPSALVSSAELQEVLEADLGSRVHSDRIKEKALAYEAVVARHLRSRGVEFWTEDDLRAGRGPAVTATPDFLLRHPVTIGGRRVCWIDAKDYTMYGSALVRRSLQTQSAKYTRLFGPGAFVFSGGVACEKKTAGGIAALLLDGSWL